MDPTKVDIFSLNVGMSATLAGLSSIVNSEKLDIIFLQEINVSKEHWSIISKVLKLLLILTLTIPTGLELQWCGARNCLCLMF